MMFCRAQKKIATWFLLEILKDFTQSKTENKIGQNGYTDN